MTAALTLLPLVLAAMPIIAAAAFFLCSAPRSRAKIRQAEAEQDRRFRARLAPPPQRS